MQQHDIIEYKNRIAELERQLQSLRKPGKYQNAVESQQLKDQLLSEIYNLEYLIKTEGLT